MLNFLKTKARYAIQIAIALTPWLISMYLLFWLGKNHVWVPETLHRDKITLVILVIGMGLSFLFKSYFDKHQQK